MTQTVLVTGGAGYIGSHVCKALAASGAVPVAYDTLERGHDWAVQWGPLEKGDIGDAARLDAVMARHRPLAVIHLAGYIEVGESVREPARFHKNNVVNSGVLIEAAIRHGLGAFVFSSSCAIYGLPQTDLLAEDHPVAPLSPYAENKAEIERLLVATGDRLRSASLRYFNAAGADPGGTIGEAHDPETHLMPLAIDAALGLGKPLTILGTDYDTPDGTCVRDYIHVNDLADAHVRAVGWLADHPGHAAFNLGSGTGYSVRELVEETSRIVGQPVPHSVGPRRPGDSPKLVGNIAHARTTLGWTPTRNLATQIEDALRWRRKMPRK
ncbi:MAG: UDP-glucose 4-epimerase GalE [Proteobacteria bacterium]|nr:UDP-glucose 4-epimerase GalE [Pseudomonadota bacterium]